MNITHKIIVVATVLSILTACNTGTKESNAEGGIIEGLNIGNKAPGLAYQNPEGVIVSLSSLSGKMVLIDFWAAWCPPCRRENPELVRTYLQFKDKSFKNGNGFTIYGVSLDKEKHAWTKAIADDELVWEYHVSELKGWEAQAASIYNIRSIPSNLLIDGDGIIVAKNLRGNKLSLTLQANLNE